MKANFRRVVPLALLFALATSAAADDAKLRAFPGADGFGAYVAGGRGGRVVHVTNLNANGPGSFSWAVNEVDEPRTIVFDVSGVIDCQDEVAFRIGAGNDHVTIAGETSPGGIAVYNYRSFVLRDAEEVIVRFVRLRGSTIHLRNNPDGLLIWHAKRVIVDHCSVAGACDETISGSDVDDVTVEWCGFDESRKAEAHSDYFDNDGQWHNYGGLYSHARNVSIHHCLFAHHSKRNPLAAKDSYVEAVDNVIYNYSNSQQTWGAEGDGLKIAGCLFKLGPDRRKRPVPVRDDALAIRGCVSLERDGSPGPPIPDQGELGSLRLDSVESAEEAYARVLRLAGALPHDATSARMVRETETGTGQQGYLGDIDADRRALASSTPTPEDSDRDGIPDAWEREHNLDPADAADGSKPSPTGYTWLERYCHELAAALTSPSPSGRGPG